jgi:Reverse transcriptase (RNA-dependent DNA polymerase)
LPCDLPAGAQLLDYVTVFRTKMNAAWAITERKTRININGAQQQEGLHFDAEKLYAPVADKDCIRLVLAAAAMENLEVRHSPDIASALLHGTLDEEIIMFMRQPPRSDGPYRYPSKVYRVVRSMYGARQAPYIFTIKLSEKLIGWGYRRATADASNVYRLAPDNVNFVILVITLDDFCSASNSEAYLEQCREQLVCIYSVKDLSPVHSLIGWRIQTPSHYLSAGVHSLNHTQVRTRRMQICADTSPGHRPHCSHTRVWRCWGHKEH